MTDFLARAWLCLMLTASAFPALAQEEEPPAEDQQLMVDPAFSDDPEDRKSVV